MEIALLANAVVEAQVWPEEWKKAELSPLWKKKGCRQDPANYRPIALLPAISRVVERMIAVQLRSHVERNNILPLFQHGFRTAHSCETAIMHTVNEMAGAKRDGEHVVIVSCDLASAFDSLEHSVLMQKLEHIVGLRGPVLGLMKNYLAERSQRT
eukprot:gene57012-biopygen31242